MTLSCKYKYMKPWCFIKVQIHEMRIKENDALTKLEDVWTI